MDEMTNFEIQLFNAFLENLAKLIEDAESPEIAARIVRESKIKA